MDIPVAPASIDVPTNATTIHFDNLSMGEINVSAMNESNRILRHIPDGARAADVSGLVQAIGPVTIGRIAVMLGGEQLDALNWSPLKPSMGTATIYFFTVKLPEWVQPGEYSVRIRAYLVDGRVTPSQPF